MSGHWTEPFPVPYGRSVRPHGMSDVSRPISRDSSGWSCLRYLNTAIIFGATTCCLSGLQCSKIRMLTLIDDYSRISLIEDSAIRIGADDVFEQFTKELLALGCPNSAKSTGARNRSLYGSVIGWHMLRWIQPTSSRAVLGRAITV